MNDDSQDDITRSVGEFLNDFSNLKDVTNCVLPRHDHLKIRRM